jgi:hypothetical protein
MLQVGFGVGDITLQVGMEMPGGFGKRVGKASVTFCSPRVPRRDGSAVSGFSASCRKKRLGECAQWSGNQRTAYSKARS